MRSGIIVAVFLVAVLCATLGALAGMSYLDAQHAHEATQRVQSAFDEHLRACNRELRIDLSQWKAMQERQASLDAQIQEVQRAKQAALDVVKLRRDEAMAGRPAVKKGGVGGK